MNGVKMPRVMIFVLGVVMSVDSWSSATQVNVGPYVYFYKRGAVTIYWQTDAPVASVIEYGMKPDLSQRVEDSTLKSDHELTIPVRSLTLYSYRIVAGETTTATHEFYSAFDYGPDPFPSGPSPYPTDSLTAKYEQAAQYIADQLPFAKGYCIVYGCGKGRLAYEIAKRTNLKIIGFEEDANKVKVARNALDRADIYGNRVTVLQGSLSSLPSSDFSANLIVSDTIIAEGVCLGSAAEMFRLLRPDGGVAFLGQPPGCPNPLSVNSLNSWLGSYGTSVSDANGIWATVERSGLSGTGEWSHQWGNPAATTCSEDTKITYPVKMLWFGEPGPRYIIDRHHRPGCSLYKDGHLVVPGLHRVMALDAYNGARLWDVAIPNSSRVGALRDAGWVALSLDYAYAAASDDCVGLNIETGKPTLFYTVPQEIPGKNMDWGYLATDGDLLFGSAQFSGASRIGYDFDISNNGLISQVYRNNQEVITSRYLFCLNRHNDNAAPLWIYKQGSDASSVIVNPAICVSEDSVYFIESRNATALQDSDGRIKLRTLFDGNQEYLVKLNRQTGARVWEKQIDLQFQHVSWLQYANNILLASGTWGGSENDDNYNGPWTYGMYAYTASGTGEGDFKWNTNVSVSGVGDYYHGGQDKHPAIVGGKIYWQPNKFDLQSGTQESWAGFSQGGCGTISTSAHFAFNRIGSGGMHNLTSGSSHTLCNETRVGCYINIVPAGGLVLVPESGSGCICSYSMQASMAFVPD